MNYEEIIKKMDVMRDNVRFIDRYFKGENYEWIIGHSLYHTLKVYVERNFAYYPCEDKDIKLMGIPATIDHDHPERLELYKKAGVADRCIRDMWPESIYITTASRPDDSLLQKEIEKAMVTIPPLNVGRATESLAKLSARLATIQELEDRARRKFKAPEIDRVIYNNPATIVFWKDGTKTVVKAQDEAFDEEKGLAMAIVKKLYGNDSKYFDKLKKYLPKIKKKPVKKKQDDLKDRKGWRDLNPMFALKKDATAVLKAMHKILDSDGYVTLLTLYELSSVANDYADDELGWTSLDFVDVCKLDDGSWQLTLPAPKKLKK